ncbi:hook 1-like protein [Camelus ferus]|nr:hook 1-like protein [Camelus ferus]
MNRIRKSSGKLQTFKTAAPCQDVKQLTNGVAMAQVLHQIDVAWFNESWLSRIKEDISDNWRIKLMSKEILSSPANDAVGELEQQLKRALEELQEALAEKEELRQRCQELDMQVTALQDEKNSLVSENEMMNEKLDQLDGSFDDPNTMVAKKYFHAQLQLEQLQEENFRATSDKANKLESTVEVYRQKLQDLNDLRKQVKTLQETNMMYMHNTVSLEEELKKANAARTQLETYKRQVQDLHVKLSSESKRADTLAFEMKRLEEKHEALLKEKERLIEQRDTLKETNEELRCSQVQQDHLNQTGASATKSYENLAAEIMPVEYREVFIRLQHENKMLRLQQEGTENERIEELQEQLEQKHRKMNELETEQREKLTEVHEELQKKQELIEDLQPDVNQNVLCPLALTGTGYSNTGLHRDSLNVDCSDLSRENDYRQVIKTLDPKLNPASAEIMLLRKQLAEKERRIEILESECKVAKFRDYEEKLIVSAWYNKSLAFQKLGMESRLVSGSGTCKDTGACAPARSFLAQQRHITNTRRHLSVKIPATTSD